MTPIPKRIIPILIMDVFVLLICILGFGQNIYKAGLNPDDHVSFDVQDGRLIVDNIYDSRFSQIQISDKLQTIAGYDPHSKEELEFIQDKFDVGAQLDIVVERSGALHTFQIILPAYYTGFYLSIQLIVGAMFLILGIFVLYKQPDLQEARIWHWASMGTGIIIFCTFGRYTFLYPAVGHLVRIAFITSYALVPTLFIYISFIFPRIKFHNIQFLIRSMFGLSILLILIQIFLYLRAMYPVSVEAYHHFILVFDVTRVYFASGLLFGVGNLLHSYFTVREEYEKRKIRWILLGLCTGPPIFVICWQIPQILSYDAFLPEEFIVLIMIIIPITFSIAIIRYNIFNIDLLIRRSTIYFFIVSFLVILYTLIVGSVIMIIGSFTFQSSLIVSIISAILTIMLFDRVRRAMQEFINRKFFRVNYNYRVAQQRFTRQINECINISSLSELIITNIDELLGVAFSSFFTMNSLTREWQLHSGTKDKIDGSDIKFIISLSKDKAERIFSTGENLVEPDLDTCLIKETLPESAEIGLIVIIKTQNGEVNAVLVTGAKKSATRFSLDDIDLLKTMSSETGLAIERMDLQQKIFLRDMEAEYLKEINSIKSTFVSSVSHELSTPLSAIKMFAEILREKHDLSASDKNEYLTIIRTESDRLEHYIKNVLDLSKIERGEMSYHPTPIGLNNVINEVLDLMQFQFAQHSCKVDRRLSDSEIPVFADKSALTAALINLLYNALKYSGKDKYIRITTTSVDTLASIIIQDKGIGISTDDQEKIFDVFYRSQDRQVQTLGGAGLGLTLVTHFLKAHKGKIDLKSVLGEGSTFFLTLPVSSS